MDAQVAGGGRSSARETIGRVAAGAVAKKLLRMIAGVEVSLLVCDPFTPCFSSRHKGTIPSPRNFEPFTSDTR